MSFRYSFHAAALILSYMHVVSIFWSIPTHTQFVPCPVPHCKSFQTTENEKAAKFQEESSIPSTSEISS